VHRVRVVALAVVACTVAGCGGGGPSDAELVRASLQRFATAVSHHDWQALCGRILAPKLVQDIESVGVACPVAVRGFGAARRPRLAVDRVHVDGDGATARVRTTAANQAPSTDTVALVKVGGEWRISSLGTR
jgi:hypothetical protein